MAIERIFAASVLKAGTVKGTFTANARSMEVERSAPGVAILVQPGKTEITVPSAIPSDGYAPCFRLMPLPFAILTDGILTDGLRECCCHQRRRSRQEFPRKCNDAGGADAVHRRAFPMCA